jgi:hypothetical protein
MIVSAGLKTLLALLIGELLMNRGTLTTVVMVLVGIAAVIFIMRAI